MTRPSRLRLRRPSLQDTLRANQAALDFYRATSARPDAERVVVDGIRPARAPNPSPRPRAGKPDTRPLERDVLASVLAYLRRHPEVAFAGRLNTMAAINDAGRPIWAHSLGRGAPDIIGCMVRGAAWIAIECKRPGERLREEQAAFLSTVRQTGGCAGLASSIEDAAEIISAWLATRSAKR